MNLCHTCMVWKNRCTIIIGLFLRLCVGVICIERLSRDTMKCEIHVEITISQTPSNSTTRHKSFTTLRLVFARKIRAL